MQDDFGPLLRLGRRQSGAAEMASDCAANNGGVVMLRLVPCDGAEATIWVAAFLEG
jgi:hypothetical protein